MMKKQILFSLVTLTLLPLHSYGKEALPSNDKALAHVAQPLSRKEQQQPEPPFSISLDYALRFAFFHNKELQMAAIAPQLSETEVAINRTVYDPALFSENSYYDHRRPVQSLLDTGREATDEDNTLEESGWMSKSGIRQPLPTGGDITISYQASHLEGNSDLILPNPQFTSKVKLELRQSLLKHFGDKVNKTQIELAEFASNKANAQYEKSAEWLLKQVAENYWLCKYYFELEQINENGVNHARRIIAIVRTLADQGISNALDIDRATSTLIERKIKLQDAKKQRKITESKLKLLLGIATKSKEFYASLVPEEPFTLTLPSATQEELVKESLLKRKELVIVRQKMEIAKSQLELATHMKLPTLDAKAGYTLNGLGDDIAEATDSSLADGKTSWEAGLILEWDIGNRKSSLKAQQATLKLKAAQIEYEKITEEIVYEVSSLYSELQESYTEVEETRDAEATYEKILERERTLYELSKVGNQRILDSQDDYLAASRSRLKALLDYNITLSRLKWAQGGFFDMQMQEEEEEIAP